MSKYIDVGKLKYEIERRNLSNRYITTEGYEEELYEIIDSLEEEQESVAERFARIVRGNLIGIDKEVQQKFENLYFEITGNKMYGGYND